MHCTLVSINKRRGSLLIELLLVALIGSSLVGILFYALNSGSAVNDISSAKVFAQSETRRISDWVTRDLRQAQLGNLAPLVTQTTIKFNPVLGVNLSDGTYQLDFTRFIEYVYNASAHTLTRNLLDGAGNVLQSWVFTDVMDQPFYTRNGANLIYLDNNVLTTKNIVSVITIAKTSQKGVAVEASLTTETKIRNE